MKNLFNLFLTLILSLNLLGQTATVNDPDGYSNVRNAPNTDSEVIYKVSTDEIFLLGEDFSDEEKAWTTVYIMKNKFSLDCADPSYFKGYIHKSRILPIEKMQGYDGNEFKFKYETKPFDSTENIYDYYNDTPIITSINGRKAWGTDGGLPKIQVKNIIIELNGIEIKAPRVLFSDIFEVNNSFKVYKKDNTYFIDQWNSDGAGGYNLVWVITEAGIIQRFIFTP